MQVRSTSAGESRYGNTGLSNHDEMRPSSGGDVFTAGPLARAAHRCSRHPGGRKRKQLAVVTLIDGEASVVYKPVKKSHTAITSGLQPAAALMAVKDKDISEVQ